MKKIAKTIISVIAILSLLVVVPVNKAKAQFSASISIQTFYSELSPYGQWIDDPQYGYVWAPDAGTGFRPYYTRGHWVMTAYGAMWVSGYSWGWAPFHYGRWVYNSYYGWVWIPDTNWGPAWVSWRWGGDYCGWAPLGPGISVSMSFGGGYSVPNDWWVFVPQRYCLSTSFYNYRIAPERNITYIRNTTIINNTYVNNNITYAAGPRATDIQRVTGSKVSVYNVANVSRPGKTSLQGNAVRTYRPQVTNKGNTKPAPPAVVTKDQFIKSKTQRSVGVSKNNGRTQQIDQTTQQIEKNQVQQQNNNRAERGKQINPTIQRTEKRNISKVPERNQQINQPPQQTERRQIPQQNNNRQVMPEHRQQINQPPQQTERRQIPQQNNNRQVMPEHRQEINQPQQQNPQQSKPGNRGKGKGNN